MRTRGAHRGCRPQSRLLPPQEGSCTRSGGSAPAQEEGEMLAAAWPSPESGRLLLQSWKP